MSKSRRCSDGDCCARQTSGFHDDCGREEEQDGDGHEGK